MIDDRRGFCDTLSTILEGWMVPVSGPQLDLLYRHFEAVVETNRVMNLTRITEPRQAAIKHYADSLSLLLWVRERGMNVSTLLDVGTGAGFPAVPLAVMNPQWDISAIDSTGKKVDFVDKIAQDLTLTNLHACHARAEHWHPERTFSVVVARAAGKPEKILTQSAHLVAARGRLVLYQATETQPQKQPGAKPSQPSSKLGFVEFFPYGLPLDGETIHRTLGVYAKRK